MAWQFDEDTRVKRMGEAVWGGAVSSRWNIGDTPNGGYVMAIGMSALAEASTQPDPLTVTAHYIDRTAPGDVEITVEALRTSRNQWVGQARMVQGGALRVLLTASYTDFDGHRGPTVIHARPPRVPALELCEPVPHNSPHIPECARRFEIRFTPAAAGILRGRPPEVAELGGWLRFADGREPDLRALAVMADAFPPPVENMVGVRWIPTLTFTVHFRAKPTPGWIRAWFATRFLIDGYLEEDGELWDAEDRLVALSRQMARIRER